MKGWKKIITVIIFWNGEDKHMYGNLSHAYNK